MCFESFSYSRLIFVLQGDLYTMFGPTRARSPTKSILKQTSYPESQVTFSFASTLILATLYLIVIYQAVLLFQYFHPKTGLIQLEEHFVEVNHHKLFH